MKKLTGVRLTKRAVYYKDTLIMVPVGALRVNSPLMLDLRLEFRYLGFPDFVASRSTVIFLSG